MEQGAGGRGEELTSGVLHQEGSKNNQSIAFPIEIAVMSKELEAVANQPLVPTSKSKPQHQHHLNLRKANSNKQLKIVSYFLPHLNKMNYTK
jgi:hypothetical protein